MTASNLQYTSVDLFRNDVLFRCVDRNTGRRMKIREPLKPRLYIQSNEGKAEFRDVYGVPAKAMDFDSPREARDFASRYEDVENFKIYGSSQYHYVWLNELYSEVEEIEYSSSNLLIFNFDIEVAADEGFPQPDIADKEITAITVEVDNFYYVFGCGPYTPHIDNVKYIRSNNEHDLLVQFIKFWSEEQPDVVSGWNIETFDIPYLVNRIERILGEGWSKKLSVWGMVKPRVIHGNFGKEHTVYEIVGTSTLDYLSLYKKFILKPRENYKLDYIAHVELGEKKIDYSEYSSLLELYKKDYQKFIEYNIEDTALVRRLDNKLKLIDLVCAIAYSIRVNFNTALTTVKLWEVLIHNHLIRKNIVVPYSAKNSRGVSIPGGYVKEPHKGRQPWEVSLDLTSLYPMLTIMFNISPETLRHHIGGNLGSQDAIDSLIPLLENDEFSEDLRKKDLTLTGSGYMFSRDHQGFIPELMQKYFNKRDEYKGKMKDSKKELELIKTEMRKRGMEIE